MATEQNEKALRLNTQLQEALQPLFEKLESMEQEVSDLKNEQKSLKQWLEENK